MTRHPVHEAERGEAVMGAHDSGAVLAARLRLKRTFLTTLIVSLSACALVAAGALLLNQFSETTAKILLTLGGVGLHSGVAMACAAALERGRTPRLAMAGLLLFGVNFVGLMLAIWLPGRLGEEAGRACFTTGALLGFYVLAIPGGVLAEGTTRRALGGATLAACALGLTLVTFCIWADPSGDTFAKVTAIAAIVAFSLAQTSLLARLVLGPGRGGLLYGVLGLVWATALLAGVMIAYELDEDFYFRALGALGVLDASGSLALLILSRLQRVSRVERLESAAARVELRCPRCLVQQTVDAGSAACRACGLKLRIEIEEPRCTTCDYLLWQLPERRCPECGTSF